MDNLHDSNKFMTQTEALKLALEALERIDLWLKTRYSGIGLVGVELEAITAIKEALSTKCVAQPDQYKQGYADAMNWKVQNHLEHLPVAWKLMPREATREMLEAMDECSMEGYDKRLYAGHAASVYMAAWDEAPTPQQPKEPEQEPRTAEEKLARMKAELAYMRKAQPEQEPVAFETWHKTNHVQSLEKYGDTYKNSHVRCRHEGWLGAKSIPPQRTWVGLTDEEIDAIDAEITKAGYCQMKFARAIEAKLKEKNNA